MPKPAVGRRPTRRHVTSRPTELPDVVEGQLAELCRDLAVEAKRMRQLHDQADELRSLIGQWVNQPGADAYDRPPTRGGRR
jgi:hypothetical protein